MAFSADETQVWLHDDDGDDSDEYILTEWDLKSGQCLRSINYLADKNGWYPSRPSLLFHPDDWALWQSPDPSVVFHDFRSGRISRPSIADGRLTSLTFASSSPDGKLIVLGHDLGVVTVWETASLNQGATPHLVKTLGGILMSFHGATFFADGSRLLAGSSGSEAIKVWETQGYNELLTLEGDGSFFYNIHFSADGSFLGALNAQGKLHLWRAPTWEEINALEKSAEASSGKEARR
jgi:WD40 repeat protein